MSNNHDVQEFLVEVVMDRPDHSEGLAERHDPHPCLQIFGLMNLIIDRLGDSVKPFAEGLLRLLPEVWQDAEGQSLLRIQVCKQCSACAVTVIISLSFASMFSPFGLALGTAACNMQLTCMQPEWFNQCCTMDVIKSATCPSCFAQLMLLNQHAEKDWFAPSLVAHAATTACHVLLKGCSFFAGLTGPAAIGECPRARFPCLLQSTAAHFTAVHLHTSGTCCIVSCLAWHLCLGRRPPPLPAPIA